jgi:hypothetical protein
LARSHRAIAAGRGVATDPAGAVSGEVAALRGEVEELRQAQAQAGRGRPSTRRCRAAAAAAVRAGANRWRTEPSPGERPGCRGAGPDRDAAGRAEARGGQPGRNWLH